MGHCCKFLVSFGLSAGLGLLFVGCGVEQQSQAQPSRPGAPGNGQAEKPPLVDVAIAVSSDTNLEGSYTGTTLPNKIVTVRSRLEGQLLTLNADVGDAVGRGSLLGVIEPDLLMTEVNEAEAELAAREFEVRETEAELREIEADIAQNKAELKQAQADAKRLQDLADTGAIATQQAEVAQTAEVTAVQILNASEAQLITQQQAIAAAQKRVTAQQAILAQTEERLTRTQIISPQTGIVLSKNAEAGDIIQAGQDLLAIGDLSQIKVSVQISDRDLSEFSRGQQVTVQLDAFPNQTFPGTVTKISPIADAEARLIPIEITIPNVTGKIAAGLLARISKETLLVPTVMIPVSALEIAETKGDVIFIPTTIGEETTVQTRVVNVGNIENGMAEIISGLAPNDRYVVKSDRPLETGQTVTLSLLSAP